ncbi:hypothetical protein OAN22_02480 [Alphaproteobacteria bacterium]|nr:hypothetical protein [Alphaproteobacteria bacterium]
MNSRSQCYSTPILHLFFSTLIALLSLFMPAHAIAKNVLLDAKGGVECHKETGICTARDDVKVYYGDYQSTSDIVDATFNTDKTISIIDARGAVKLTYGPEYRATADTLHYTVAQGTVLLKGHAYLSDIPKKLHVMAPHFLMQLGHDRKIDWAKAPKNFSARAPNMRLQGQTAHIKMTSGDYTIKEQMRLVFPSGVIWGNHGNGNFKREEHHIYGENHPERPQEATTQLAPPVYVLLIRKKQNLQSAAR